jgi:hypothetical protein
MNWNKWVRQTHRVLAMVFTATVVLAIVVLALQGPVWVSYLPLSPLAVLLFSGLYLYVLPFVASRRGGRTGDLPPHRVSGPRARSSARWIRPLHRWAAAVFTVTVAATFVALALPEPVVWVSYLPLLPLILLLFSGLYMFVLPYRAARHNTLGVHSDSSGREPTLSNETSSTP